MTTLTIGLTEAKIKLSEIIEKINKTGEPVTIFKNNKPSAVLYPIKSTTNSLATENQETLAAIAEIEAMRADPNHRPYTDFEDFWRALERDAENA